MSSKDQNMLRKVLSIRHITSYQFSNAHICLFVLQEICYVLTDCLLPAKQFKDTETTKLRQTPLLITLCYHIICYSIT